MNLLLKRAALATLVAGSFYAGAAYAADARLDDAIASIDKAVAQLEAAQNGDQHREFGGHRKAAILLLKQAKTQVEKAKTYADNHPPPDGGS